MIAKNPKSHFVVALLDIDDFKFINDIYGHAYGDKALKNLADSMKNFFPSNALIGRNGGDEFCIFLPNCTYDDAEEQLEQFIKSITIVNIGKRIHVCQSLKFVFIFFR